MCSGTNLHALNVATLNLVIDGRILAGQIYDFPVLCDRKLYSFSALGQITVGSFAFFDTVFPVWQRVRSSRSDTVNAGTDCFNDFALIVELAVYQHGIVIERDNLKGSVFQRCAALCFGILCL